MKLRNLMKRENDLFSYFSNVFTPVAEKRARNVHSKALS